MYEELLKDKDVILDRINLVSESPLCEVENNRYRNIAIILVLSIIAGVVVTFIANFLQSSKAGNVKDK